MLNVTFFTKNTETDKVSVTIQDKCQLETITSAKNFYENSNIKDFSYPLPSLMDGEGMFKNCQNLTSFDSDLSSLVNGKDMFYYNTNLESFDGDLSNLQNGESMFYHCTTLTSFDGDLSSLTNGYYMFNNTALTSFSGDLSSLEDGSYMFYCCDLASFSSDLSSLEDGCYMFGSGGKSGVKITEFHCDMPKLTNGFRMFYDSALESFSGDLSSLEDGTEMFSGCKLDAPSVLNIAESINDEVVDAPLTISIDSSSDMTELDSFAQDIYYDNWYDLCRTFHNKGWTVTWSHTDGYPTIYTKYNDCYDVDEVTAVDANYKTDLRNGEWVYLLDNLTDGTTMFYKSDIESFSGDLSSLVIGDRMFADTDIQSFNSNLSSLTNGFSMFAFTVLQSFNSNLSSLTDGNNMFHGNPLQSFNGDMPKLTNGNWMFYSTAIQSFNGDMPKLINGDQMFWYTALASFSGDLSSLTNGNLMFTSTSLQSFNNNLSNLVYGYGMFRHNHPRLYGVWHFEMVNGTRTRITETVVSNGLKSFISDLSSLKSGYHMFGSGGDVAYTENGSTITTITKDITPLDEESIRLIADTINDISSLDKTDSSDWTYTSYDYDGNLITETISLNYRGVLHLGYDATTITDTTNINTYCDEIVAKGWTVYLNGSKYTSTDNGSVALIDGESSTSTPIPHYYKPVQVTDEDVAEYVDGNGNYYIIVGGQHVFGDDISTYGMFTSFEHAIELISLRLGLSRYVKPTKE